MPPIESSVTWGWAVSVMCVSVLLPEPPIGGCTRHPPAKSPQSSPCLTSPRPAAAPLRVGPYGGPKLGPPPRTGTDSTDRPAESVQVSGSERTSWTPARRLLSGRPQVRVLSGASLTRVFAVVSWSRAAGEVYRGGITGPFAGLDAAGAPAPAEAVVLCAAARSLAGDRCAVRCAVSTARCSTFWRG
jgi:hypothetical protein